MPRPYITITVVNNNKDTVSVLDLFYKGDLPLDSQKYGSLNSFDFVRGTIRGLWKYKIESQREAGLKYP